MSYNDPYGSYDPYTDDGEAASQAIPLSIGKSLAEMPGQYIASIMQPSLHTFAREKGKAKWGGVLVQLLIVAVFVEALNYFHTILLASTLDPETAIRVRVATPPLLQLFSQPGSGSMIQLVSMLLAFFIANGFFFLLAKAFRGTGTFLQQCYTTLLWYGPISILAGVVAFIPAIGSWLALATDIYGIVLAICAIMGTHHLRGGNASAVVLLPLALVFLIGCSVSLFIVISMIARPPQ